MSSIGDESVLFFYLELTTVSTRLPSLRGHTRDLTVGLAGPLALNAVHSYFYTNHPIPVILMLRSSNFSIRFSLGLVQEA